MVKICFALLMTLCLQVSAHGYSQEKFSFHVRQVGAHEIFNAIQQESKYRFFYNNDYLRQLGKVDLDVTDVPLARILDQVLAGKFGYTIRDGRKVIITPVKPVAPSGSAAPGSAGSAASPAKPDTAVKGKITDETGKPLGGVTVRLGKGGRAVQTDENGNYTIDAETGDELVISYVGYKEQRVKVDGSKNIPVQLQPNATGLADAVVVGYGTQRKRDVTGSVSTVKGDDFKNLPVSNAATALQGRASGVDIIRDDGSPGSSPSIRIRGTGTVNNSDPLVVIDGVPANGLNDVNPNDIASIEILKDASSSAIYGSRAANGVVLITTKKGNFGEQLKTTVGYYNGFDKAAKYLDLLTAPDLVKLKQEAYTNDGRTVPAVWQGTTYATQKTDWQRALFNTGHTQNADFAMRGGNTTSTYSFSGNYYDQKGIIDNSYFKRYSFRINSEHKIFDRLKVGENIVYSHTDGSAPNTKSSQTGLVWSAIRFNPGIPVKNPDGSWGSSQSDAQLGDINNPVATANEIDKSDKFDRILANGYAELEIIKGLKLRANYGYDQSTEDFYEFDNATPDQARGPGSATLTRGSGKSWSFLEEYYLTYNKTFGSHSLNLTGGYSAQTFKGNYFNGTRIGYDDTSIYQRVLNLGNSGSAGNSGFNTPSAGLQSYFVRANYAFMGKYLFTGTFRADGSSKFPPGKRWGYFPAFSAGWRVSDEDFFRDNVKAINSLKITGGWGELGNQNVGPFQYLSGIGYGGGGGLGGGGFGYSTGTSTSYQNGAYVISIANPNITWERAVMTNISAELTTLNNHLAATVTYFNKNTTDMLIPFQIVETFGAQNGNGLATDDAGNISLPDLNQGRINNHGVEIELNYSNTAGKVGYSFGVNGSFIRNKVTRLFGPSVYLAGPIYGRENVDISRTYEGQPVASFYGFKTDGLYQTQDDINKAADVANDPNKGDIKPGDVHFRDLNGDGVIDDKDRTRLGDPNPKFEFGVHGSVNYKGFDLSFNFAGATGFKLYNADRLVGLDATQVYNWYAEQNGRWHGAGTSNSIPRLSVNNLNNNYRSSDMWVQNGAYISLKNVAIGYTLPKVQIGSTKIPEIRIYVSSYNTFTITGYKGYTPELGYTNPGASGPSVQNPYATTPGLQRGVDVAQYPQSRNITIGGTVSF
ncbi:MAG TPA: TonB-dependent receptor [Puia sp.]|jgi:TonB-linked SusC/RagA family outer membrane protein